MSITTRAEAAALLLTLTPEEAQIWPRRTVELAEIHNDLGAGMRMALQEIAEARAASQIGITATLTATDDDDTLGSTVDGAA